MIVSYQTSKGSLHKDGPIRGRREGVGAVANNRNFTVS